MGRDVPSACDFKRLGSQHPDLHTMEVAMPTTTEGANGGGVERRGTRGVDERRVASFFLNNQKRVFLFCFVFRGGVWWCLTDFLYSKKNVEIYYIMLGNRGVCTFRARFLLV